MKNTYVHCKDWSWEDKLLYIKACIGEDMPHEGFCGHAVNSKNELLNTYRLEAGFIYHRDGMLSYDTPRANPSTGALKEIDIQTLRAAALKDKPKRVKVEYVKVEESIFDLKGDFKRGELYCGHYGGYALISVDSYLADCYSQGEVYRRLETEISERDEFIEAVYKHAQLNDCINFTESMAGLLFDSGKFKLVD